MILELLELALELVLVVAVCAMLHRAHRRDRERWRELEREGDRLYAAALLAILREHARREREERKR